MMFTRRRMESVRSTGSTTPADELTSWLPDDVCITCHAQVLAGQLYCSQECREDDAKPEFVKENELRGVDWFFYYVSIVPEFVIAFWGVIGPSVFNIR